MSDDWQKDWARYSEQQTKRMNAAGCKWPGTPRVNGRVSEIVCCAIMEQSKGS